MLEALLVLAVLGLLVGFGLLAGFASLQTTFVLGMACVALGCGIGIPAGVYYHVKLHRALREMGTVPRSFWLHPTRLHTRLDARQWRGVAPWFYLGAAAFALIVLGCVVVLVAVWKA